MRAFTDEMRSRRQARTPVHTAMRQVGNGRTGEERLHGIGQLAGAIVVGDHDRQRRAIRVGSPGVERRDDQRQHRLCAARRHDRRRTESRRDLANIVARRERGGDGFEPRDRGGRRRTILLVVVVFVYHRRAEAYVPAPPIGATPCPAPPTS